MSRRKYKYQYGAGRAGNNVYGIGAINREEKRRRNTYRTGTGYSNRYSGSGRGEGLVGVFVRLIVGQLARVIMAVDSVEDGCLR